MSGRKKKGNKQKSDAKVPEANLVNNIKGHLSSTSLTSNDTPLKRNKDNSILSPNVFELLDSYENDSDKAPPRTSNLHSISDDVDVDASELLLNRLPKSVDQLTRKVDTYHVQGRDIEQRLTACEVRAMSGIDVKLDINNALHTHTTPSMMST